MTNKELLQREIEEIPETMAGEVLHFIQALKKSPPTSSDFFQAVDLDTLAKQHNVLPIAKIEDISSNFWPEEENIDEFITQIYRWREE